LFDDRTIRPVTCLAGGGSSPRGQPSVNDEVRLPATASGWVAVELDVRLYLRDEITTLMVAIRVHHE